ncbi:hypothetical protein PFISCL1PPCAC_26960, partial [Pristionchus fissidentatus]
NLAKDKTLNAQKVRVKKWINSNFKALGLTKKGIPEAVTISHGALESRWRIVAYYKGLLAKIKPKLTTVKFDEVYNNKEKNSILQFPNVHIIV